MHKLDSCKLKVEHLQEVIKIYLMITIGRTDRLGGLACGLLDILLLLCEEECSKASRQLDAMSIGILTTLTESVIERLEQLEDTSAEAHKQAHARINPINNPAIGIQQHLLLLKSVLVDLSIVTKADFTPVSQKLQELIHAIRS